MEKKKKSPSGRGKVEEKGRLSSMEKRFVNVYSEKGRLYTPNLFKGADFGENIIKKSGKELRSWDPNRSKLAAAIINKLENFPFKKGSKVLYLGGAQGQTPSYISDIVGKKGLIYCVEFSERAGRDLMNLSMKRKNIAPIIEDARKPRDYNWVEEVDIIYEDVAQPDQIKILKRNSDMFLKKGGYFMLALKARSIDVVKPSKEIFEDAEKDLEKNFSVLEMINLSPFEKDHVMIIGKK